MENGDKVICALCDKEFYSLEAHLMYKHNISPQEYKIKFPGRKIRAASVVQKQKATIMRNYGVDHNSKIPAVKEIHREKCKSFYASPEGLLRRKEQGVKRNQTMLERYGKVSTTLGRRKTEEEKKRQEEAVFQKYGVRNVAQVPEIKERIIETTRKTQSKRPSELEMKVEAFLPPYIKYTGDWKFWVTFLNGHKKNPDFVVRPFRKWRKVVEVNSLHYHTLEEAEKVTKEYEKIGIQCLVIWMEELEEPDKLRKKIATFLALPPQRLQIKQPEKVDGIV